MYNCTTFTYKYNKRFNKYLKRLIKMGNSGEKVVKKTITEDEDSVGMFERLGALAKKANLKLPAFIKKVLCDFADNEEQKNS